MEKKYRKKVGISDIDIELDIFDALIEFHEIEFRESRLFQFIFS